jgi:amino acid transporter
VLTAFYALLSAGFSCLAHAPIDAASRLVPQLAIAEQTGSKLALGLMVGLCLLASFTSFNGALLALARFAYALASQGALPRVFARLDPKTRVPRDVLARRRPGSASARRSPNSGDRRSSGARWRSASSRSRSG